MIYGCGIDIEEVDRFNKHYFEKGKLSDLLYDIFTTKEIENYSYFGKEAFLKGFCFKEAFYKALNSNEVDYKDIEVFFSDNKNFEIVKSDLVKDIFSELIINRIVASLQSNDKYAVFKVVLINK